MPKKPEKYIVELTSTFNVSEYYRILILDLLLSPDFWRTAPGLIQMAADFYGSNPTSDQKFVCYSKPQFFPQKPIVRGN